MNVSLASWLVIAVALALANLPFLNEYVFGFIPLKAPQPGVARVKPLWVRLLEMVLLYFVVGALAYALESRIGNVFEQAKEFYMLTVPLFVTLAFPGFVMRYLHKRHH
jgi:ABC-type Na+ efflux pump permease subunit